MLQYSTLQILAVVSIIVAVAGISYYSHKRAPKGRTGAQKPCCSRPHDTDAPIGHAVSSYSGMPRINACKCCTEESMVSAGTEPKDAP